MTQDICNVLRGRRQDYSNESPPLPYFVPSFADVYTSRVSLVHSGSTCTHNTVDPLIHTVDPLTHAPNSGSTCTHNTMDPLIRTVDPLTHAPNSGSTHTHNTMDPLIRTVDPLTHAPVDLLVQWSINTTVPTEAVHWYCVCICDPLCASTIRLLHSHS